MHARRSLTAVSLGLVSAASAVAQTASPSPAQRAQIQQVIDATRPLATRTAAHAAGFDPVLGWVPTMGVHYVNDARMATAKNFDMKQPDNLMFSPIGGRDSLVGAAYAYFTAATDTDRPATFDGNPAWHEHDNLAPPGQTLTMLHVWFVPSPDGPFAGHNPNLSFWALGLTPPDPKTWLGDPAGDARVRKASMALSLVVDSSGLFPRLAVREPLHTKLMAKRDSARALVPELLAAEKAKDNARWNRAADKLAALWDGTRELYVEVAPPTRLARMQTVMDEMTSAGHGAHSHHP